LLPPRSGGSKASWQSLVSVGCCLGLFDTCPCNATVPRVAQA
jgi:hypothetical protein